MAAEAQKHEISQMGKVADLNKQLVDMNNYHHKINNERNKVIQESNKETSPLRNAKPAIHTQLIEAPV